MPTKKKLLGTWLLLLCTGFLYAQNKPVTGKITDSVSGSPLQGVVISILNGKKSVVTNEKGEFTLIVSESAKRILQISYVGFSTQTVSIGEASHVVVQLVPNAKKEDEIVVVAYGSQRKSSLTSSVATVNPKSLTETPAADISNSLGGRAAGILFKQSSGEPGYDNADIKIRGIGTIGNSSALVIIDGVERDLSSIDPHDVQSFSILKDAASVAPYGVRGANGILLVTTKRGNTNGKISVLYDGKMGWTNPTVRPKELNSFGWASLKNEAARNEGVAEPYSAVALQKFKDGSDPDFYANENGVNRLLKTGIYQQHNLSVAGGTQNLSFYSSLGYVDQTSMWGEATRFKRYTVRSNIDFRISPTTKASLDFTGIFRDANFPGTSGGPGFILMGLWRLNPTNPIFYKDGKPAGYFERNPYLDINGSGYFKENFYTQFLTLKLEQKIPFVEGLVIRGNVSFDKTDRQNKQWRTPYTFYQIMPGNPPTYVSGKGNVPLASLMQSYNFTSRLNTQLMLNYSKKFSKHSLDLLGVFEPRIDRQNNLSATQLNYQLLIDELSVSGNSNAADRSITGGSSKITQVGYVYRASYNYNYKYFFEAAGRYDGQSYFNPNAKFAFFPSFSLAWRLSEEPFFKNLKNLNNLKLRASWGKVGNLADLAFQYLRLYEFGNTYLFNGVSNSSVYEVREPSPNITWEKATKSDIGVEVNMFQNKLNIEADYFYERRKDMLLASTALLPAEYGIGIGQENTGVMENRGFDFKISTYQTINKNLSFSGAFNFTYAKNSILNINEPQSIKDNPNRTQVGKSFTQPFGYKSLGLFQSQSEIDKTPYAKALGFVKPGDVKYLDLNGDGKLNSDDIMPIGNPVFPRLIYGFEAGMEYRKFRLDLLFQGASSVTTYLSGWAATPFNQSNGVAFEHQLNVWRPDNPNAEFPRILSNPGNYSYNNYVSDFWQRSGNYLRLKTVSVGYTFSKPVKTIASIKLYAAAQNLFTFTKVKYMDPEQPNTTDYYFQQRVISVGSTVNF